MKMLSKQISMNFGEESTLSPEASPASLSPSQAIERGRKMTAISSRRCLEQFGRFSRVGSWQKTFAALLLNREGWCSSRCALQWKLSGTRYNRLYFQLVPSTLPTEETACGLLPTVQTQGMKRCENGRTVFTPLSMLPTPRATEIVEDPAKKAARTKDRTANAMPNLSSMVVYRPDLLPTQKAQDCRAALRNRGKRERSVLMP